MGMATRKFSCSSLKIAIILTLGFISLAVTPSPSPAQGFSVSYGNLEFTVRPGENTKTSFSVTNLSEEVKVVRIYSGDWVRTQEGIDGYQFEEETGKEPRSLVRWMTVGPDQMELGPGETREVHCEIDFPDDQILEGSYWGVVFVEEAPPALPAVENPVGDNMQVGINTIFRYAVKIFATFEGTEIRDGSFTNLQIVQLETGYRISALFENPGNVYMRPEVWLEIRDTDGVVIYQEQYVQQTVLPESSREYAFDLNDLSLAPGTYLLMVIADFGGPNLVAAQGRMVLTEPSGGPAE
jgi:hypothetical protein